MLTIESTFEILETYTTSCCAINSPTPECPSLENTDIIKLVKYLKTNGISISESNSTKKLSSKKDYVITLPLYDSMNEGNINEINLKDKKSKLELTLTNIHSSYNPEGLIGGSIHHKQGIEGNIKYSCKDYQKGTEIMEKIEKDVKEFYNIQRMKSEERKRNKIEEIIYEKLDPKEFEELVLKNLPLKSLPPKN